MRILLLNPGFSGIYGNYAPAAKVGVLYPPLGLASLAANIKGDHEIKIMDLEIDPDLVATLKSYRPDIVGITFTTPLYNSALDLFKKIK
ncbi:MAG: cobalamin-dependent protein, partial [Planctomycetes bacterium]|nr:cobalamin-dependent protein [Planctomycetota bacterium]